MIEVILLALVLTDPVNADEKVKYCKDAVTGEIYIVEAGMPCPGNSHEL